eukprot:TRINITY_DN3328_c0_g2_i1.p1 TRINITY_DN3328_c0_g2~~TRINITY_DN3328_c0_g2_i1.p1  ORF type:complete len:160 (-),score=17.50 TRINITY_DN3328_c0_g2_i1:162-641(-)
MTQANIQWDATTRSVTEMTIANDTATMTTTGPNAVIQSPPISHGLTVSRKIIMTSNSRWEIGVIPNTNKLPAGEPQLSKFYGAYCIGTAAGTKSAIDLQHLTTHFRYPLVTVTIDFDKHEISYHTIERIRPSDPMDNSWTTFAKGKKNNPRWIDWVYRS